MNLPGYDAWKLETPPGYEMTSEEEKKIAEHAAGMEQDLRDAVACALADVRCDLYLTTIRRIVIEELNKLRPLPGEPEWQTKTPVPIPEMG